MEFYKQTEEDLYKNLKASAQGLSEEDAKKRLEEYGPNELNQREKTPLYKLLLDVWKDPMLIILAIVVLIKAVLGDYIEASIILAVIVINSLISIIQTKKAESSLEALRQISSPIAKVRRGNKIITLPTRELVPGDVVILEAGDYVPADGRIILCNTLKVDEGLLTGESEPVLKVHDILEGNLTLGDRKNMVYGGTVVVYGRGEFIVTATAKQAEIGKIASLIEAAEERQTPLQRKLEHFSKKLGLVIMALCVLIFVVQIGRAIQEGAELSEVILGAFLFAIAVAVAAIPEALSSIVTIVLASGTKKMATKNAIIRKLPAVEALGSTGIICTDKTGTLTQNKMTVVNYFLPGNSEFLDSLLLPSMVLCNDAVVKTDGEALGDPTETALLTFCDKSGKLHKDIRESYERLDEIPFDSERKLMSTLHNMDGKRIFTKGAPDVIFSRCTHVVVNGEVQPFTKEISKKFEFENEEFGSKALRVLAYATKMVDKETIEVEDEYDLTLIGLTAMIDPPREEVYDCIAQAKTAGIKTVMITGDHKNTAFAIAKDIGIAGEGDIAVTGVELEKMTEAELDEKLESISVYARVSPENKISIVRAWQRKGMITAMTGDGVNDAPSLKQADIGVAMGSGTEVSKDAAAMVLTDDNFATIVNAVSIGRTIFDNIKKVVGYLFSGNLAAILAIIFAFIVGWDSPFTALQILFINLINDSIPAIALGLEKSEPNVMRRPPRDMNEGIFGGGLFRSVLIRGILMGIATIVAQFVGTTLFSPEIGQTMAFTTIILARTLQTFSSRSNSQSVFRVGIFTNMYAVFAVMFCLGLYGVTVIPALRDVFHIYETFGFNHFRYCFRTFCSERLYSLK